MVSIKFITQATVKNIHVRNEGSKSEGTQVPALDIKMAGHVPRETLPALLGCSNSQAQVFWTGPENLPSFPQLAEIKSNAAFENCNARIAKKTYQAAKLRGISFRISDEGLDLVFTVSFSGLTDAGSGFLCGLFHETVLVEIESAQIDAFEDEPEGGENE